MGILAKIKEKKKRKKQKAAVFLTFTPDQFSQLPLLDCRGAQLPCSPHIACHPSILSPVSPSISPSPSSKSRKKKRTFPVWDRFQLLTELVLPKGEESCRTHMAGEATSHRWGEKSFQKMGRVRKLWIQQGPLQWESLIFHSPLVRWRATQNWPGQVRLPLKRESCKANQKNLHSKRRR